MSNFPATKKDVQDMQNLLSDRDFIKLLSDRGFSYCAMGLVAQALVDKCDEISQFFRKEDE
jgi:hypothetical protein